MSSNSLEEVRKYLSRRRDGGQSVVYRIGGESSRPAGSRSGAGGATDHRQAEGAPAPEVEASLPPAETGAPVPESALDAPPAGKAAATLRRDSRGSAHEAQAGGNERREPPPRPGMQRESAAFQGSLFEANEKRERPGAGAPDLKSLADLVSGCTRCPLCHGRTQTVFGSGSPDARIVFIGEAPGREEDLQGLPFVGRAGKLLTKMLASVGMTRDEVYITNILKCRPPNNRDPSEEESRACEPYLERQIELIKPALICALGRVAGQKLLRRNASLSVLRQGLHYYGDVRVIVTYHPAALLRNPNLKRDAWEDIKMMRRLYDEALEEQED